jgi:hypothetical protein
MQFLLDTPHFSCSLVTVREFPGFRCAEWKTSSSFEDLVVCIRTFWVTRLTSTLDRPDDQLLASVPPIELDSMIIVHSICY